MTNTIQTNSQEESESMELIRDNVKVEWVELGEGWNGDYDENDPNDVELLRFDVSVLINGEWVEKEDASYCTRFPVSAPDEQKIKGLQLLMNEFHDALSGDVENSVKKLGERLSWIGPDWVGE